MEIFIYYTFIYESLSYTSAGLKTTHKMRQHVIPQFMNTKWKTENKFGYKGIAVRKFLRKYYEKKDDKKRRAHKYEAEIRQ